jgi:hypothetical protein
MALGLFCETRKIIRREYQSLREILQLINSEDTQGLSGRVDRLVEQCRRRTPRARLYKAKIKLQPVKLPTGDQARKGRIYWYDARDLIITILHSPKLKDRVHFDMADIVDAPQELWEGECYDWLLRAGRNAGHAKKCLQHD